MWQQEMIVNRFVNVRPHLNEYSVFFINNKNFNVLQIYQIFSSWGRVKNIKPRCGGAGFVFVNYETEAEARRCVIGMMSQNLIQLCTFNHKNPTQISSNSNIQVQNDSNRNERNVNTEDLRPTVSPFFHASKKTPMPNFPPTFVARTNFGEIAAERSLVDLWKVTNDGSESRYRGKNLKTVEKKELTHTLVKSVDKDQEIVAAQEVIVGNIPETCGVPYVLHLLEKYHPICISSLKTLWKHDLRYCHVYFRTPKDAEAVEAHYDAVQLDGKSLIVMRPAKLAAYAQTV